jgi:lipoprotein NlpI
LSRLFISHSSKNDDWAIALKDWLVHEGWSGPDDIFLDLDPERGISAGQRWAHALEDAATRCEAVLFIVSNEWLGSKWCADEYQLANKLNKKLFALLADDIALEQLPGGLAAQWQIVRLKGEPAERFVTVHPLTQRQSPIHIAQAGLKSLKRGLEKAGIGAETFELQHDADGPFGWRAPYRGLEALEPEDAAVFFGRSADVLRGIDDLRGLAARKPPRLFVILGGSGAGKSSFLRAGLWPRLLRDDGQWLPLRAIRAGRGGAIEGREGLLAALEEVHRRFAQRTSRANLRDGLATPEAFVELLRKLRQAAAQRALISEPPYPLPVLCVDQGEELFAAEAGAESERFLQLARAAIDADAALLLVTIRSDAYGAMQSAKLLAEVDQVPLSLGPVPHGEIGRVIREPAEILRRKVGPAAPAFDAAVIARLQAEIEGESDALPLLAFVLQRLMREHEGAGTIGLAELERTGGVAAAIESEAEAALADAGVSSDRGARREALRRLFIPRLARVDRDSKTPQRRIARQGEMPADYLSLAKALTARRLLVVKLAGEAPGSATEAATLEVAHEALLRRWPTLADLLAEDRDALLLLDGVLSAAADWDKADAVSKLDFLAHRGSRLTDAQALSSRGGDWGQAMAPAQAYLAACHAREVAEQAEKESKRRRVIAASLAAAVVLAATTVIAGLQWRSAQVARDQARQGLGAVTDLARTLVVQIGHDFVINGEKKEAERLFDRAIQSFDQVIRLSPNAPAYSGRGAAYLLKGDFDDAVADFDQATKLDPRYANAYHNRGIARRVLGEFGQAIADFDRAIAIDPKYALAYYERGVTYFDQGALVRALADLKQSSLLNPKRIDTALWLYLVERQNNVPTDLAQSAKLFDGQGWPTPVIRLFLGKASPAEILQIARTTGPENKEGQICEAEFYVGEFDLLNGAKEDAGRLLRLAAENCPQIYEVRRAAEAEIKALAKVQ